MQTQNRAGAQKPKNAGQRNSRKNQPRENGREKDNRGKVGSGKDSWEKDDRGRAGSRKDSREKDNRGKTGSGKDGRIRKQYAKQTVPTGKGSTEQPRESVCPVEGRCGGCGGGFQDYAGHLKKKEREAKGFCREVRTWEPAIGMEQPRHYRHKVHAVFGEDRRHNIISGTYEEKSHRIVPVDACLLDDPRADAIIVSIRGLLGSFRIRPFNEDTGYGLLRHVLIRTGLHTGQIMVVLVLASPVMPSKNHFVKALLKLHPEITTIVLNVNGRGTSMVLGEKETVLYGKGYIEDTLCGKTFRISARSFYQVNPFQTERLYAKAVEYAGLTGSETVLDAYCGTGTIGLIASGHAGEVIGVELNSAAVRDARINARVNGIRNAVFYENDAGRFMVDLAEQGAEVDVVFMDPPRAGSDNAFLSSLVRLAPRRVVYVSCNPETLGRDLQYLTRNGYSAVKGVVVDMFPWTGHVECVIMMQYCGKEKKK